jgi:endoglucanase
MDGDKIMGRNVQMSWSRNLIRHTAAALAIVLAAGTTLAHAEKALDPFKQVKQMRRGVNIIGYDPIWKDFEKRRFQEKHFKLIKEAGFQTVRMNLHGFDHMDATGKLDDSFFTTLDWAVKNALANDLNVIFDLHNYTDIAKDPAAYKARFLGFWRQVAPRYKDASNRVMFEILNEPNGELTPQLWNEYLHEALAIIRETNPTRNVVIGPGFWNQISYLKDLDLPKDDRHIIVTIHYYAPMQFTHQGAYWSPETVHLSGIKWGTDAEKRKVVDDFAKAQAWSKANHRPILLGEFGAYDKGDMDSRVAYTSHLARTAESLGWAWTYWQFDSDFIVYNIDKDQWVEPIKKALIP